MRRTAILIISILISVTSWGQAQINTKKVKIGDFTQKITKIVLTGKSFMDGTLQDEVVARWRVTPYEFCTLEEFEELKTSSDYYFLISTSGQFKKDASPSIQFLTLVKGGEEAKKGIDEMLEIVSMPVSSAQFPSGRELIFMPAFLDIIQDHALKSMEKDMNAYGGLSNSTEKFDKKEDVRVIISKDDICGELDEELLAELTEKGVEIVAEDEVDDAFANSSVKTIVSYVVAPFDAEPGSYCYKMLIDTQSHALYYFKRHRISRNLGKGFLPEDMKRIKASL